MERCPVDHNCRHRLYASRLGSCYTIRVLAKMYELHVVASGIQRVSNLTLSLDTYRTASVIENSRCFHSRYLQKDFKCQWGLPTFARASSNCSHATRYYNRRHLRDQRWAPAGHRPEILFMTFSPAIRVLDGWITSPVVFALPPPLRPTLAHTAYSCFLRLC